ncbi:alpha/beta hydrolase family protein [Streptomyces niger]|uniref:alpha/beta hydrolase family protein n=1 Tax=Streptomyces niger TaxID=66373 RepID=UPI00069AC2DA|nr:alpha/beta fold hydrolase [Streptomyces niger]
MRSTTTAPKSGEEFAGYRFVDHVARRAVSSLSHVIGVKSVTRPFWNRWRASGIDDEILMKFLGAIDSIEDWPHAAMELVTDAERNLPALSSHTVDERVAYLRRLSYLAHMAQWGCLPMTDLKRDAYRKSRDYYVEAETLAWGENYLQVRIPFNGHDYAGNLHLPTGDPERSPLVVILHGMDDTKEEHLATENELCAAGFAVLGIDGPGQGESLILEDKTWPADFHGIVPAAIDALAEPYRLDAERVGVIGISWGGLWAVKAAAADERVAAVYDLGGPIDAGRWKKLPYFLKSKYGQVLGIESPDDLPDYRTTFSITDEELLSKVRVPVRIIHGAKDPLVKVRDKEWLQQTLKELHPGQDVSLLTYADGDHCCTGHGAEIRADGAAFFSRVLGVPAAPLDEQRNRAERTTA